MKRWTMWGALAVAVALAGYGCSSGTSVSGSLQGHPMSAQDAIMTQETTTAAFAVAIATINISNVCSTLVSDLMKGQEPPNIDELVIEVSDTSPIAATTYNVSATSTTPPFAEALAFVTGSTCATTLDGGLAIATGGSVTFSSISTSNASGKFTLSFGADQLTGTFNAGTCTVPDGGIASSDGGVSCQ